jgi:hypothetical protein
MKREKIKRVAGMAILVGLLMAGCGGSESVESGLSAGNGGGTGITNTFTSPAQMGVGDIMPIEFSDSDQVAIDFEGVESGTRFILAVGSYNETGLGTSIHMAADLALPEPGALTKGMAVDGGAEAIEDDGFGPEEIFSAWLRASENELDEFEIPADEASSDHNFKAMSAKAAGLGSTETFRVLSTLTSTTAYVSVTGKVRCEGQEVIFYVDTSVSDSELSDEDVQELCNEFDDIAAEEQDLFGDASDVDGDGKVHVLMTSQINRLGALGGGIITGYFYAGDLYARSASNPVSNHREVIYTMVPDPSGRYGTVISKGFAMANLLPAVLPHELQHAISYNQHVFVNGGAPEESWLNEGMSHLTEDLMGYNVENPSRYGMYLASPSTYGLVAQGSPNLMERGAAYLFLRFLYEQAADGDAFLRALQDTSSRGVQNIEQAFNGPAGFSQFSEFVSRWVAALAMTDRGISQDRRYTYQPRVRNSATGNWGGVCLDCQVDDGRGTVLSGVNLNTYLGYHVSNIDGGTAKFFVLSTLPHEMRLEGSAAGDNFGILIRTQ